jgi:hypothetical protein
VRDLQTLLWHFAGPIRDKQLWVFTASRAGMMLGYAIFKRQDHPPSGLTRMRLVDYQSLDSTDCLAPLLNAALTRARAEGIFTVEHVCCGLPKMRILDDTAPYRRRLLSWPYYYKAADPNVEAALKVPNTWDASSYDGDCSL